MSDGEFPLLPRPGRALSASNVLVVDGLTPGDYSLMQSHEGKDTSWDISPGPGAQAFDLGTGDFGWRAPSRRGPDGS